jgi:hypothetical protein
LNQILGFKTSKLPSNCSANLWVDGAVAVVVVVVVVVVV